MLQAVVLPTQKLKDCDCGESPDASYLNVIVSRSAVWFLDSYMVPQVVVNAQSALEAFEEILT